MEEVLVESGLGSDKGRLVLALIYLVSVVVLVVKMASPVNIHIEIHGEQGINVREISNVYTFTDLVITTIAAIAMTSSGLSIVLLGRFAQKSKLISPSIKRMKSLSENEKKIVDLLQDRGGVTFQSEIVEALKLSKSTVSITLDRLEAKGLVEKRKRGMSNVIIAKQRETQS